MPLISFSKPRSKKSPTAISSLSSNQTIPAGPSTTTSSFHVNPSSTASLSISPKGSRSLGRTKDRFSKAFTFSLESFNVAGSIRGRSKPIKDINNNFSSHSISHSHTTYTGYEDEEYGEPDVEAEEIRPPSGLGRTATTLEFNDDSIDIERSDPIFTSLSRPSIKPRTSQSSDDGDSLVEIRYPSGLGDIKVTITPVSVARAKLPARSTYPDFYLQCQSTRTNLSLHKCRSPAKKTVNPPLFPFTPPPVLLGFNSSTSLCKLLPVLNPYLDTTTLTMLTLVDRGVGLEARKLLWCQVRMPLRLVLCESGRMALLDGQKAASFLDFLSKKDVSHFIKSLELICRLELESSCAQRPSDPVKIIQPQRPHPRTRPPPLFLVLNNHNTSRMACNVTQSPAPPTPPLVTARTNNSSSPSAPSPFRRASMIIRNSSIPNAFRNSNLGRRLSMLKPPPGRVLPAEGSTPPTGDIREQTSPGTQSQSSHLTSLSISSSTWQPPPEWDRVDRRPSSSPLQRSTSPSSSPTLPLNTTSDPPVASKPFSLSTPVSILPSLSNRTTRHVPSLPNLKPEKSQSRLSLSLSPEAQSTPSLNSRPSPIAPPSTFLYYNNYGSLPTGSSVHLPPSSFRFEQPSPGTPSVPATPVTPQSAISLSSFPLPPPMTSRPPLSASPSKLSPTVLIPSHEGHPPSQQLSQITTAVPPISRPLNIPHLNFPSGLDGLAAKGEIAYSASIPMKSEPGKIVITAGQPGFIDGLKMGLKELGNLEAVIIRYDTTASAPNSSIDRSNLRFSLLQSANQLLVTSLKDLRALKTIRIVCPTDYLRLCSTQLSELEKIFTDVKTFVVV